LNDLTDFEWSRVVIFPSYAPNSDAEEALGFEWPAERLPTYNSDAWTTLIFATEDRVVAWCMLDTSTVDFASAIRRDLPVVLDASDAVFKGTVGVYGIIFLALEVAGSP